ncbi:hypothetical protein [Fischerella muscicola]|nr:hypothetical protein [Fischerella muscicola]
MVVITSKYDVNNLIGRIFVSLEKMRLCAIAFIHLWEDVNC